MWLLEVGFMAYRNKKTSHYLCFLWYLLYDENVILACKYFCVIVFISKNNLIKFLYILEFFLILGSVSKKNYQIILFFKYTRTFFVYAIPVRFSLFHAVFATQVPFVPGGSGTHVCRFFWNASKYSYLFISIFLALT